MRANNLIFKNNFQPFKKSFLTKKSKEFSNLLLLLKNELKNKKKTINVLDQDFQFNFKFSQLRKFLKFKKIAIIGMGGSILGAESIYYLFKRKIKKKVYFFNNIDEKKMIKFKKSENLSKILFVIISKSGNTVETLSNSFSLGIIKKNSKNIIIISEKKNNYLFNLSKQLNLFYIEHNKNIGGRYSVLSETGIVPSLLMGLNINKLRSDLLFFLKKMNINYLKESSIIISKILDSKKKNNLIMLNYSPELEKFLFWCQQLFAESLGKKNKGFLPVISNVPKDHHSLLQLYLDGPKDKIFYIFSIDQESNIKINTKEYNGKKNVINNKFLGSVKKAQKKALIKNFIKEKIPFREFRLKKINERELGQLFSYFIVETIFIGKLSKINPFNQPAVELVKNFTFQYLNQKNQK